MLVKSKLACQPRFDFRGHRAIVTGGSRGIGRAIADALGEAGAQVYAFDVGEPEQSRASRIGSCASISPIPTP